MKKILTIFIVLLFSLTLSGCDLFKKEECNQTETCSCNPPEETKVEEAKNYMHVFTYENGYKGYDMYAFLNNQGVEMQVFDYNGKLYLSEGDSSACIFAITDGKIKFDDHVYACTEAEDNEAILTELGINTSDVSSVKLINSCRSDAAPFILFVLKDGTVTRFENLEGRYEFTKDYFKETKVKDVTSFKCEHLEEAGFRDSVFTIMLEDGTTKQITK